MYRLDEVLQPPPPPELQRTRHSIIRHLSIATTLAGVTYFCVLGLTGWALLAGLAHGALLPALVGLPILIASYYTIGVALCATFMSRLRLWGGASLAQVVRAKDNFVRYWPFESTRLLRVLILHRLTGSGLPPSYPPPQS